MPAALKTPRYEPEIAPDNLEPQAVPTEGAAVAVSAPPRRTARRSGRTRDEEELERFGGARTAAPTARASTSERASVAVRYERRHRPLKLPLTIAFCIAAILFELVALLWLHSRTMTAAREVEKLDARIAEVSNHVERTQERIAAYDSTPQIKQWAAQRGWRPANHSDFDLVTEPRRSSPAPPAPSQQ